MGRRHFLKEILHMDYEDLRKLYHQLGTIELVADRLGVTSRSVKKWFVEGGIEGIRHVVRKRAPEKRNALYRWVHAHPGEKLPRGARAISEKTGIPQTSVATYLNRRKKRFTRWLSTQVPLTKLNCTLRAVDGSYVPTKAILDYAYKVDLYSLKILFYGQRIVGLPFKIYMTPKEFKELIAQTTSHPSELEHL